MKTSAMQIANNASFHAFINCYLREVDSGVWHSTSEWQQKTGLRFTENETNVLELQLDKLNITLAVGVCYRSIVGRHQISCVYQQQQNQFNWQLMDSLSVIMLLIDNIYFTDIAKPHNSHSISKPLPFEKHKLELIARVIESHQIMARYIEERRDDPVLYAPNFIDSEQSILFGHWLHPTPKSRQGMHTWQHQHYTPELCSQFQLHFFEVDRKLIRQSSILEQSSEEMVHDIIRKDSNSDALFAAINQTPQDKVLLPVHPLQAQWLLHQDYIQQLIQKGVIKDYGYIGPQFTPTSSIRTLYNAELDFMIKLSIPVKITNSLRVNMEHELDAGVLVAKLLQYSGFSTEHPEFQLINDPAYITVELPDQKESGFEVIFRENPFSKQCQKPLTNVHSIAALVQEPIEPNTHSRLAEIIYKQVNIENKNVKEIGLKWFDAYWLCAIEPAIRLYDTQGIALEAHQQNSLLDVTDCYPKQYFYRDNQGFYLSEAIRPQLVKLEPGLLKISNLFYSDEMICERFSYYLIINQLFSVINRLGLDHIVDEMQLLELTYTKLQTLLTEMQGQGIAFINGLLEKPEIPCKGNLLTRIDDVDELQADLELAVYTNITNPLYFVNRRYQLHQANLLNNEACLESA